MFFHHKKGSVPFSPATFHRNLNVENKKRKLKLFDFVRTVKSQIVDFFAGHKSQETRIETAFPQQLMKTFIWQRSDGSKYIVVLSNQLELVTKIALNESGAVQLRNAIDSYLADQKRQQNSLD